MDALMLVEPQTKYTDEIWSLRKEIAIYDDNNEDQFSGCMYLNTCPSVEDWIVKCARMKQEETYREEWAPVPTTIYLAVRVKDQKVVGSIELRHHIECPHLKLWGGHIGYSVRPSERRKGYGKEMLRLCLEKAKERELDKIMISCAEGNFASEKTILANGGGFEKTVEVEGHCIRLYWISL